MTLNEAETLLAVHLQELGLHFEQQFAYCPGRKFRADFAVWNPRLPRWTQVGRHLSTRFALIEVVGGVWTRQAHSSIKGVLADIERLNLATKADWKMLRFTPDQVLDGTAKRLISEAL